MKSRITTYLLAVAVLAVWGFVAWKIFFSKPDTPITTVDRPSETERANPEEDLLMLNYGDPFLRSIGETKPFVQTVRQEHESKPPIAIPSKKPSRPKIKPPIEYSGTIEKGGQVSHLFEYGGLLHTLSPGEELGGYTLIAIYADSIRFAKNEEFFTILIRR